MPTWEIASALARAWGIDCVAHRLDELPGSGGSSLVSADAVANRVKRLPAKVSARRRSVLAANADNRDVQRQQCEQTASRSGCLVKQIKARRGLPAGAQDHRRYVPGGRHT